MYSLGEVGYKPNDRAAALVKALEADKQPVGIFYQDANRPQYQSELLYLKSSLLRTPSNKRNLAQLMKEFI